MTIESSLVEKNLSHFVLKTRRQYYIDKVQGPLIKALCLLANRYPEPTFENMSHPNAKVWLRVWDKFFEKEDNPGRLSLFQAIRKVFIGKSIEIDPYYRDREQVFHELWLDEVLKGNWKPRSLDHPESNWKGDPNVRTAGYEFLKVMYYYPEKRETLKSILGGKI